MELWRGVSINGAGGVVLELCHNKLSRSLCRTIAAYAGLRVSLQFIQRDSDGLAMDFAHPVISAHKGGQ